MGCIKFISQKKKSVESAISFIQCFIWVSDLERAKTDPTKIADTETLVESGGRVVRLVVCLWSHKDIKHSSYPSTKDQI